MLTELRSELLDKSYKLFCLDNKPFLDLSSEEVLSRDGLVYILPIFRRLVLDEE